MIGGAASAAPPIDLNGATTYDECMGDERNDPRWRVWVAGGLVALVVIVALQNSQRVDVNVLMVNLSAPLIVVILAAAAIGAAAGYVAPLIRRHCREGRVKP